MQLDQILGLGRARNQAVVDPPRPSRLEARDDEAE